MVIREGRELEDHEPLAQTSLEGEASFRPELETRARHEQVAQQPELVGLEDDGVSIGGRTTHYAPSPELPLALSVSPHSDGDPVTSAIGRILAAVVIAARTIWSFSRS